MNLKYYTKKEVKNLPGPLPRWLRSPGAWLISTKPQGRMGERGKSVATVYSSEQDANTIMLALNARAKRQNLLKTFRI
jgi:hypothetical protein